MEQTVKTYITNKQFDDLANYLLFNTRLNINNTHFYRLLEIELYICNDNHKDIFTHCHSKQKNMLQWYFHQMSEKEDSYKGGTYKGLDIACGFDGGYGGILIRAVINETDNTIIDGPCNVVNELLKITKCDSIKNLITDKSKMNNNLSCLNNSVIKLETNIYNKHKIFKGPRIGLTLKGKNVEEKKKYIDLSYRYVLDKQKVKKERKKLVEF